MQTDLNEQALRVDRRKRRVVLTFFGAAVTVGGCMFVFKLFAFLTTVRRDEIAGFAYNPILIYGFVAAGFLLLLGWAFMTGQFRDIEGIKHEWMERYAEQERAERKGDRG
ncbi:MAG: hypothetical protein O2816_15365 [Planctomycetota bacterium]|nr:hypothetical protein [Planctomycetota bacterium]